METSNPYNPPSAPVRDVPSEDIAHELSGRAIRLGAYLLDGLVGAILMYAPLFMFFDIPALLRNAQQGNLTLLLRALVATLPGFAIYLAVTIWLEIRNRQTIGKKLVGIKVARSNGEQVGLGRLFWMRNVLIGLLYAIPIVGYVVVLVDHLLIFRQSQKCLHDQIADTIVIKA